MVEAASDGGPLCCNRSVALYAQGGCGVPGCEACDVLHRLELTDQIALADLSQIKTPCPNHDYYMPVVLLWFHCDDMLVATDRMDPVDFHLIQLRYTGEDVDWFACCGAAFLDRRFEYHLKSRRWWQPHFEQLVTTAKSVVSQNASAELRTEYVREVAYVVSRDPEIAGDYRASAAYIFRVIADSAAYTVHPKNPEVKKRLDQVSRYCRKLSVLSDRMQACRARLITLLLATAAAAAVVLVLLLLLLVVYRPVPLGTLFQICSFVSRCSSCLSKAAA